VLAGAHLRTLEEKAVLLAEFEVVDVKLTDDRRALDRVAVQIVPARAGIPVAQVKRALAPAWTRTESLSIMFMRRLLLENSIQNY